MNFMSSRPKKSPSSKARPKSKRAARPARRRAKTPTPAALLRREFRQWRATLPTALERDTLLMPEAIADSVVAEASRNLDAELPADFPDRLSAKAYHLYPRHRYFHKVLNRPGDRGRHNLYVYMRHWTAGWLQRERPALYRRLPCSYANGHPLPRTAGR